MQKTLPLNTSPPNPFLVLRKGFSIFAKSMGMKTNTIEKIATKKKINWALPNQTVTHDEFMDAIKEAEKGPFYTLEEAKERLKQWKKARGL
jgi:hypothetical protein